MSMSLEVQLERMDSKLEKHIGVTETILRNQERTLEEIKDIVGHHDEKFITRDDAELMEAAALAKASHEMNTTLAGFENRLDKKYGWIVATVVTVLTLAISFAELFFQIFTGV